jgi:DNA-binding CsgD family transcriptional regulator
MLDPHLSAAAADELLHSPRALCHRLLDPQRGRVPAAMLDCAAHMLLLAGDFERLMAPALGFIVRELNVTRCDAGLGAATDAWFVSTCQHIQPGADVRDVVGLPLPNGHWVPQATWHADRPLSFDVADDPRCADLRQVPALRESRRILVRRMAHAGLAVGQVCADQVLDGHAWRDDELRCFDQIVVGFVAPLAWLHTRRQAGPRPARPTAAELAAIRLVAQGLSYKVAAARMGKSVRTVSNQLDSARRRVGARNEVELIRRCRPWLDE